MNLTELTWTLPHVVAGVMVLSLNAYVLLGGADFGGGVWDLLARGEERDAQRSLIAEAIGPIWEANHVWLILVVVLLFTCFPRAYAHLATALHLPITLMLVGVVLRGSAFTFRTYDSARDAVQRRWGRIFSIASVVTPVLLGVCLGTMASGRIPMASDPLTLRTASVPGTPAVRSFTEQYLWPWAGAPFGWAVGALTLALFAFLAAVYLTVEAPTPALRAVFRRRALQAQGAVVLLAVVTIGVAAVQVPWVYAGLTQGHAALAVHAVTAVATIGCTLALRTDRFPLARLAAAIEASCLLWGWAWTQFPYLIPPSHTITALAAPRVTLTLVLSVLGVGTAILLPSFVYLFRTFKGSGSAFEPH